MGMGEPLANYEAVVESVTKDVDLSQDHPTERLERLLLEIGDDQLPQLAVETGGRDGLEVPG